MSAAPTRATNTVAAVLLGAKPLAFRAIAPSHVPSRMTKDDTPNCLHTERRQGRAVSRADACMLAQDASITIV